MSAPLVTPEMLKRFRDHKEPHHLYRYYDADGLLLYIGCTSDPTRRIANHRHSRRESSKLVTACMDHYEVETQTHAGVIAGQKAERDAIWFEAPLFNKQWQQEPGWIIHLQILDYLAERGISRDGLVKVLVETEAACGVTS